MDEPERDLFCKIEISDDDVYDAMKDILGYLYALVPAGSGAMIMLIVALLVNNIPGIRRYPEFWF